jgi:ABC-type sulfate/molybdate transport systems ATPase subunit
VTTPAWQVELHGRIGGLAMDVRFEAGGGPTILVGPNGAGKTTVLRTIAGADTGLRGCVRLHGRTLLDTAASMCLPPESRRIGYVPQGLGLFPHLTALDNVAFGCGRGPTARQRAHAVLERLGALHLAERRPHALSGGERQRIALARALAIEPAGLLLDEPLSALDVGQRRRTRELLASHLCEAGLPAIVVTHDVRDVLALGGQLVMLEAGRVAQVGRAAELAAAPGTEFVADLLEPLMPGVAPSGREGE